MTHICVSKQTIIGSDNGLSPGQRQAIIWTNAGILLIGNLGTNFSEILIDIRIFSFKKKGLNVSSAKWWPFCLGLNVLIVWVVLLFELWCLGVHAVAFNQRNTFTFEKKYTHSDNIAHSLRAISLYLISHWSIGNDIASIVTLLVYLN